MVIRGCFFAGAMLCAPAAWAQRAVEPVDSRSPTAVLALCHAEGDAYVGDPSAERARQAFFEGLKQLHGEEWTAAEISFRRSLQFVRRESTLYNLALVLFKQRRPKESLAILYALLKVEPNGKTGESERYRNYAETLLPHVRAQVSTVLLSISAPDASVRIDGESIAKKGHAWSAELDPGVHRVDISAAGFQSKHLELALKPGEEHRGRVELSALRSQGNGAPVTRSEPGSNSARPSNSHSLAPWVLIGLGSAALIGGVVTGVKAKQADDEFVERCPGLRNCDPELQSVEDEAARLGRLSDVLLVSGFAAVTGGVIWRVLSVPPSPATNGTHVIQLNGRF
jgi:hypothetical protein